MIKYVYWKLVAFATFIVVATSCGYNNSAPMSTDELGNAKPEIVPLVFSSEKKLGWDTIDATLAPEVKKLDIDALPSAFFDSTGQEQFTVAPKEAHFDYNSLPSASFNLAKLPSKDLEFNVSALPALSTRKVQPAALLPNRSLAIYEFSSQQGFGDEFGLALYRDHAGILWVGNDRGLFRYDGVNLQQIVELSPSVPFISGMTEDAVGNIWFTQLGRGISKVDLHNGTLSYSDKILSVAQNVAKLTRDSAGNIWLYNAKDSAISVVDAVAHTYKNIDKKSGLSDAGCFDILEDKQHNIWISTYTSGLDIIDPAAGKIRYMRKSHGLSSDTLSAMTMDASGKIWVAESNGPNAIDVLKGILVQYGAAQGFKHSFFTFNLLADSSGKLWRCGDYRTTTLVELFDPAKSTVKQLTIKDGLRGDLVFSFVVDKFHRLWLNSMGGLQSIDQAGEVAHAFGNTAIISQMEDQLGNLWVATGNGVAIVNPDKNTVRTVNSTRGLVNDFVQSFTRLGNKMAIASNGGVSIVDPSAKTITNISRVHGLVGDTVYGMLHDNSNDRLWLNGPTAGINVVDLSVNRIFHADVSKGLSDNNVQDVKKDSEGRIWLATNRHGVDVYDPKTGTVKNLYNQPGLIDTCNRMLLPDDAGRMWIGTDKGIYVADAKHGTLTCITSAQGLSVNAVISLLKYKDKVIAGARNKVHIITLPVQGEDPGKWDLSILDKSQGLVKQNNSWATDCVTESGKYLWGDRGISIINGIKPSRDSAITYVAGMQILNRPQYFLNNDKSNGKKRVAVDGQQNYEWDSVSGPYNLPVNFTIPHQDNYMQFQFVQANSGRQDSVFYSYFLEGIDKNWSTPTINTFTENYLNLPPGNYSFKVSSKGIDGRWSVPASFSFTILPPWYKTWWAYILYGLIGIGILRGYIVYRSRRLKQENRLLEEKVQLRTKQLQQSFEELKATQTQLIQSEKMASLGELTAGIAHEIQNPLNFVNNFSDINIELLEELKEERAKALSERDDKVEDGLLEDIRQNIEKIAHHGKRADGIVKGMLQHSRSSNSIKEHTDINKLADEYFRLAYHGLRAKDKSFNATMKSDFDENTGQVNVVPQDMGRVILNLITNAFYAVTEKKKRIVEHGPKYHTDHGYEPTVSVSIRRIDSKVVIEVEDNGDGVPQKVLDKIFQPFFTTKPTGQGTGLGLSLSYDIVKAHGGELKVETEEHRFAKFTIVLPV